MNPSARQHFLTYVRTPESSRRVISPFLPHASVVQGTLTLLGLPVSGDLIKDELCLSQNLGYQPMFMTECTSLIFNWKIDESRSSGDTACRVISTQKGEWVWNSPRTEVPWSDIASNPVQTEQDHRMFIAACEQAYSRREEIQSYFRTFRSQVGDGGVIVIGHPHPSWLGFQINPTSIFYQWAEWPETYRASMDALYQAALFVMQIAIDEGIDFMSDSSYGLEMTSPELFMTMDLPYIRNFARWTHERNGLFWYHNCGYTSQFIKDGVFNTLGADVIETIAPPPEGDNDLVESRRFIDRHICTKGNLNLRLLRDGTPDQITAATHSLVNAVRGYPHIISTADAVLEGTPPQNFIAFIKSAQEAIKTPT